MSAHGRLVAEEYLETLAAHGLPVEFNNGRHGAMRRATLDMYGAGVAGETADRVRAGQQAVVNVICRG